jgi:hypothetical protein
MSPGNRPADPTVTVAPPPGALDPGWAEAVAGVLDDPSRHRLAFQPVADLQRGTVAGYEALSRFAGPPDATPDVWFEAAGRLGLGADHELDFVVVLDDWSRPVGLVDRACAAGNGQPKRTVLKTRPSTAPETVVARAMARPAADRFDPLVCVDDRGHYLGVLRIEQLVHRLLAGPRP